MRKNMRKQGLQFAAALMILGALTAANGTTQPIQTQRGVVRLGHKTQANIDANQSSVVMGQGMVLVSSKPGGLGRATVKVSFGGAPMVAKVKGTAVIAYLPGEFIEITEVEGRTYLIREGRLGENVAIDAGKMLLVKPAASRLPDTTEINLDYFVKKSPILNGDRDLTTSPLIVRSIDKQSANRYLKPTPFYFDGAGTEAIVENGKGKPPASSSYESQPLDSSLETIEVIEQLPRRFEPEQLVASVSNLNASSVLSGGEPPSTQLAPTQPPAILPPIGVDVPGGPVLQGVSQNEGVDVAPSQGFLEQFHVLDLSEPPPNQSTDATDWFPFGFPKADSDRILQQRFAHSVGPFSLVLAQPGPGNGDDSSSISPDGIAGFVQGVERFGGGFNDVVFKEAQIADPQAANFKITSLGQASSVVLKFSQADIPSDILSNTEFTKAFTAKDALNKVDFPPSNLVVGLNPNGSDITSSFNPVTPRKQLLIQLQAGQTITVSDPGFFTGDSPTMPAKPGELGQPQLHGELFGLAKSTWMGSVVVEGSGGGVSVEVGQRIVHRFVPNTFRLVERLVPGGFTFDSSGLVDPSSGQWFGMFSLQAPDPPAPSPSAAVEITAPIFRIESNGPLHIADPIFDPTTNISNLADTALISKQDIAVQSVALQQIAQTINPTTAAQTVTLVLSTTSIAKLTQGLDYWIKTPAANLRMRLQTIDKTNSTATFAAASGVTVPNIPAGALIFDQDPSLHGQLVFHNTNLNAGQEIAISSPNRIRFESSSQIQAFTDVVMQGGSTAALELLQNSAVKAANGQILLDQFRHITIDSAQLMAAVIKARVVSPTGALMINNSTLAAGSLLRLYAAGSNGTVAFSGTVKLTGKEIDIAGKTVVVQSGGKVMSSPNTTVYADTHNYNRGNFGTIKNAATNSNISSSQQRSFAARPSF